MKEEYNLFQFATKRKNSNIRSILARVKFQLIKALDDQALLRDAIIVLLDDDIIRRIELKMDGETEGLSLIFADLIKWLLNEFRKLISARWDQLPTKSKAKEVPTTYWLEAPHINFNNNLARRKFISALQNECSIQQNMRIMRMKKIWDPENTHAYI